MVDPYLRMNLITQAGPHVFLLSILFRHRAFLSDELNENPHKLAELGPSPQARELPLDLKDDILDRYVFRKCEKTSLGIVMADQPITQGMMGGWVKRIGKLLGFERNTICYTLRYAAGNNLDEDGK